MERFKIVLIVEDDADIRESLREIIMLEGYSVLEAENGQVALDLLKSGKTPEPCLILLDLMMPQLNGWQFLEVRRQTDAIAQIPTIIMTAVSEGKLPKGAIKILRKPVNIIELINAMEDHCSSKEAFNNSGRSVVA